MVGMHAGRLAGPGVVSRGRAWLRAWVQSLSMLRKTAAAVAEGAPIRPGEKVLISVRQADETMVIGTGHAIYHEDGPVAGHSWCRLGWEDIGEVRWNDEQGPLTLTHADHQGPPVVLRLPRGAPLADFAREMVTSTTLARAPLLSGGRVCGWLTARRPPGSDQVRWVLTLRDAAACSDPALQSRVAGAIAAVEADLGLTSRWHSDNHEGWWPGS
jgi:hypothetical protein